MCGYYEVTMMKTPSVNKQKSYPLLNKVLNRTYFGILLFIVPLVIVSLFRIRLLGMAPVVVFSIISPFFLIAIYVFRKRLPYLVRAWILIISAYSLGFVDLISLGMFSMGTFLFFISSVMASIFLTKYYSNLVNIITVSTYILFAFLIHQNHIQYDFDIITYFYSFEGWSSQVATFVILLIAIVYAVRGLSIASIEISDELDFKKDEVEATYMQLKAIDAELQMKYDELVLSKSEIVESELKYRTLFNNLNDFVYSIDLNGRFLTVNSKFLSTFRIEEKDVIGKSFDEFVPNSNNDSTWNSYIQAVILTKQKKKYLNSFIDPFGKLHTYEVTLIPFLIDDDVQYVIGTSHEVTSLLEKEQKIEKLAFEDQLTLLPNRTAFKQYVIRRIEEYTIGTYPFALIYIDLDNFKRINDAIGHSNGDIVLKDIASRLKEIDSHVDYLARMGGDEFAIIVNIMNTLEDLKDIVATIQMAFSLPFIFDTTQLFITSSIGITIFPYDGMIYNDLLKNADSALYEAKQNGKHDYRFFDAELKQLINRKNRMETTLVHAIDHKEIYLNYQPQYDSNRKVRGFEALMRWKNSEFGQVSPMEFIPILEESGLIIFYGEWVIREALTALKIINSHSSSEFTISVNISALQFKSGRLIDYIKSVLIELDMSPSLLELEITESTFMEDIQYVAESLSDLSKLGVSIALDDFGTGYSSLSYLRKLPLSILKIDKSFIAEIQIDSDEEVIVGSLINLAHDLKLKVVAEGIETSFQSDYLNISMCDYQQGFYLAKPMSLDAIITLVDVGNKLN
jgi:diguanylate cyclase (GGDEF)-like protein/PAS domain S-box-containing protein